MRAKPLVGCFTFWNGAVWKRLTMMKTPKMAAASSDVPGTELPVQEVGAFLSTSNSERMPNTGCRAVGQRL